MFQLWLYSKLQFCSRKDLVAQREMATEEERAEVSKMCLWVSDAKSAKLFSMSTLMFHLCARSIEAASLRKSRLCIKLKEEGGRKHSILGIDMERTKTQTSMYTHLLYRHRDTLLFDSYFAIAYVFLLDNSGNDFILSDFFVQNHR